MLLFLPIPLLQRLRAEVVTVSSVKRRRSGAAAVSGCARVCEEPVISAGSGVNEKPPSIRFVRSFFSVS